MSNESHPFSLVNSVGPNILKMDTGWGMLVMKLFKTIWCSRRRRAGRFNVHQANQKNNQGLDRVPGYVRSTSVDRPELFICNQSSELSGCCRSPVDRRPSPTGSIASTQSQSQLTPSRQLSDGERLKKVILELVDTERTYVKHLNNLLENYLEPLKNASFLSSAEVNALFGNIREIVAFQRLFLQALTEALDMEPAFHKFEHPYEFKNVLFSIGSAFLYYASQFKLYSSFCASHSKAQKVLHPSEGNQALQEFLASRNPRQQHSATLESYLIKPIQRILKYPLLLQQLKALTDPGSDEHRHLVEALKVMEKVAEHINEMQRIHEEYGAIFDHLFRQHQKSSKQVTNSSLQQPIDLSPGDLLYYGGVEWLNISDFLGKIKKGLELHAMCFVFKTAVVFLCKERLRQKKKLMVSGGGVPGKNSSSEVEIIRYQVLIPVTEVQVRASSMKDMDSHFLWELIHLKSQLQRRSEKVYHLSNSTSEFRNAFLKTIRQIIRESVRNMNIPANKPISSGSSQKPGSTNTLQPQRQGKKKQGAAAGHQSATLQRHSAGTIDYDNLESYDNVPETQQQLHQRVGSGGGKNSISAVMSDGMAGSPVWKPRDSAFPSGGGGGSSGTGASSQTLPRSHKIGVGREDHFLIYEEYGGNIYMSGGKKDQTDGQDQHDATSSKPPSGVRVSGTLEVPPSCVVCSKLVPLPTADHRMPQQTSSPSAAAAAAQSSTIRVASPNISCNSPSILAKNSLGAVTLHNAGGNSSSSTAKTSAGAVSLHNSSGNSQSSPAKNSARAVSLHNSSDNSPTSAKNSVEGVTFHNSSCSSPSFSAKNSNGGVASINGSSTPLPVLSRCSPTINGASRPYSNSIGSHSVYVAKDNPQTKFVGAESSFQASPSNVVRHRKPRTSKTSSLHINTSYSGSNSLQPSPNYSSSTPGSSLQPSPNYSSTSSNWQAASSCYPSTSSSSLQSSPSLSRSSQHHSKNINTSSNKYSASPPSHLNRAPYRSWQNSDLMDRTQDLMIDLNNALLNRSKHSSLTVNSSVGDYSNLSDDSHSDISFSSSGFSIGQLSVSTTARGCQYKFQPKSNSLNEDLWLEGSAGSYSPKSQRSSQMSQSSVSNSHVKGSYSFPTSEAGSSTDSLNGVAIGGAEGLAMTIDSLLQQLREIS